MILCDTAVIVAVINRRDQDHAICVDALRNVRVKLIIYGNTPFEVALPLR